MGGGKIRSIKSIVFDELTVSINKPQQRRAWMAATVEARDPAFSYLLG